MVKKSLEQRGVLDQLKARIRAEVYSAIEHPEECRQIVGKENILINELIREYLEFNKYKYSLSVFTAGERCLFVHYLYFGPKFYFFKFRYFLEFIFYDATFNTDISRMFTFLS